MNIFDRLSRLPLQQPTPEQQSEFDGIYRKVLVFSQNNVSGTPGFTEKYHESLGGEDQYNRFVKMTQTLQVVKKSAEDLGIDTTNK